MYAHRSGTHLMEDMRAELKMQKEEGVNVRIAKIRQKEQRVSEQREMDDQRSKFRTYDGWRSHADNTNRAYAARHVENMRSQTGGADVRVKTNTECMGIEKPVFENVIDVTTRRTVRRASRRKKQRVGKQQELQVL